MQMFDIQPSKAARNPTELRNELSISRLSPYAYRAGKAKFSERRTAPNSAAYHDPSYQLDSEIIESLVVVSQNASSADSPEASEIRSLQTTISGEEVLIKWDKEDPDGHCESIFAILELFRIDKPSLQSPDSNRVFLDRCERFHLYIVAHVYPKIAARILMGSRTWNRHPMDVLAAYPLDGLRKGLSFPTKLKVDRTGVTWLRNKYDIHPQTVSANNASSGSYVSYQVTHDNVGRWIAALTDTFSGLSDALTTMGRSRNSLILQDVVKVVHHLMLFRLLLKCELVDFLLSDGWLVREMTAARQGDLGLSCSTERATDAGNVSPGGDRVAEEAPEDEEETLENEEEARDNDEENDVFVEDSILNSPVDTIICYLKSIVAWTTAVDYLSAHPLPLPIHVYLITIPRPSFPPLDNALTNFKSTILDHPDLRDMKAEAAAFLETDYQLGSWSVTVASVHAEALMMASHVLSSRHPQRRALHCTSARRLELRLSEYFKQIKLRSPSARSVAGAVGSCTVSPYLFPGHATEP